jgi:hypothetical protein
MTYPIPKKSVWKILDDIHAEANKSVDEAIAKGLIVAGDKDAEDWQYDYTFDAALLKHLNAN